MRNLPYLLFVLIFACNYPEQETVQENHVVPPEATSLFGEPLYAADPPASQLENYEKAKADYEADPDNADNIIWYGRRTAYLGKYQDAIDIFSEGVEKFPEDPRMLRHRGHRYISTRQFDKAIDDLSKAAELIEGTENEAEPDGIPNERNIPVSSLHGNIWYHLGLAHYLNHDLPNALMAYKNSLASGSHDDNIVSNSHWLYMIHRRMGNEEAAEKVLGAMPLSMDIIENHAYYRLCMFYKGIITKEELAGKGGTGTGEAVRYGLANWYLYNGETEQAKTEIDSILAGSGWNAFGYIAAESDFVEFFQEK